MDAVINFLRGSRAARFGLSALTLILLVSAVGLLGYPVYTNFYQSRVQNRLEKQIASAEHIERYKAGKLEDGDALTRLKIPSLDVDVVVVEGTSASALRAGAGHYPATPLPCEAGNVAIAQAYSGVMWRRSDESVPLSVYPTTLCDYTTGMHLCQGILLALIARDRTGEGQKVQVNMYDSMLHMQMQEAATQLLAGNSG